MAETFKISRSDLVTYRSILHVVVNEVTRSSLLLLMRRRGVQGRTAAPRGPDPGGDEGGPQERHPQLRSPRPQTDSQQGALASLLRVVVKVGNVGGCSYGSFWIREN